MDLRKIRLDIEYDGSNYFGWQKQKELVTIQQLIEKTLTKITQRETVVTGASRTDSGVHALHQVAHCWVPDKLPDRKLHKALNYYLPNEIVIRELKTTNPDFHALRDAISKIYRYEIENRLFPNPLHRKTRWWISTPLDLKAMREGAKHLVGTKDFRAFKTAGNEPKSTVRTVFSCDIDEKEGLVQITFHGNGFLKQMIRGFVGTLVEVGKGNLTPDQVREILESKDRRKAGKNAPPQGLCLLKIYYHEDPSNGRIPLTFNH